MGFFRRNVNLIIAGTCVFSFLTGCAKAPDAELEAARAAFKAAQDAGAEKYMNKNYQNLQKAMETTEMEIAKQKGKFILNQKYKRAKDLLEKTTKLANEIKEEAPKIREQTESQVKENLGLVKGLLSETANDIKKASRSKSKAIIESLKGDLSMADSAAARAHANFAAGDALKAADDLSEVQLYIKKITDALKPPKEDGM
ncbi:MAG: hypothetical protein JW915_10710 [Chitinispirillaceae bacterium]|nr:hypothetical protein [Chitinispirillaceae bacterium]